MSPTSSVDYAPLLVKFSDHYLGMFVSGVPYHESFENALKKMGAQILTDEAVLRARDKLFRDMYLWKILPLMKDVKAQALYICLAALYARQASGETVSSEEWASLLTKEVSMKYGEAHSGDLHCHYVHDSLALGINSVTNWITFRKSGKEVIRDDLAAKAFVGWVVKRLLRYLRAEVKAVKAQQRACAH